MQSRFSEITKQLQKEFPRWFKIRKDANSNGAQFLNIFGLQFEDIEFYLQYAFDNVYIDSADISQVDIIYKATLPNSLTPDQRMTFIAEGLRMNEVVSLKQFFAGFNTKFLEHKEIFYQHPFYIDWVRKLIYVKKAYDVSEDNPEGKIRLTLKDEFDKITLETDLQTSIHHVWNFFDEFGLLLDTPRLYGEKNREYKERLLEVFKNPANSTYQGLQNSLARELGLYKKVKWYDGGTDLVMKNSNIIIDSIEVDGDKWDTNELYYDRSERLVLKANPDFTGRMRDVKFISGIELHTFINKRDYAFQEELYSIDRIATPMLQYYVDIITNQVPIMWDQFIWNESFWDIADQEMSGYGYIPNYNDAKFLNWKKYKG